MVRGGKKKSLAFSLPRFYYCELLFAFSNIYKCTRMSPSPLHSPLSPSFPFSLPFLTGSPEIAISRFVVTCQPCGHAPGPSGYLPSDDPTSEPRASWSWHTTYFFQAPDGRMTTEVVRKGFTGRGTELCRWCASMCLLLRSKASFVHTTSGLVHTLCTEPSSGQPIILNAAKPQAMVDHHRITLTPTHPPSWLLTPLRPPGSLQGCKNFAIRY